MKIDAGRDQYWRSGACRIEVYKTAHLAQLDGKTGAHKIIEVEPLNDEYCAVKTIGWEDRA